jgi:hypothetical protein
LEWTYNNVEKLEGRQVKSLSLPGYRYIHHVYRERKGGPLPVGGR